VQLPLRVAGSEDQPRQRRSAGAAHQAVAVASSIGIGQTPLPSGICLPEKDLPILLAAIEARATLTECTSDI
jgi:hypothetical protein